MLIYIAFFTTTIALSIPASVVLTLLGGFVFGVVPGTIYATVSVTLGASMAFLVYRYVLKDMIASTYQERAEQFKQAIQEQGASYLLMLNYLAVIPYFMINALAAITDIPLVTVIWTTVAGFVPQGLVYTYAGKELGSIKSVNDIFTWQVMLAFALLIALALVPIVLKRFKKIT